MTDTRSESSNGAIAPLLDGPLPIFENLIQLFLSEIIAENACADLPRTTCRMMGAKFPRKNGGVISKNSELMNMKWALLDIN